MKNYTFVIKMDIVIKMRLIKKCNLKYAYRCIIPLGKTCCGELELQRFAMQSFST